MYILPIGGKILDRYAQSVGFKRKRYFWIFKESDRSLRERIVKYSNRFWFHS